jgi:hypothetical protein
MTGQAINLPATTEVISALQQRRIELSQQLDWRFRSSINYNYGNKIICGRFPGAE